jgi:hypothetical protein
MIFSFEKSGIAILMQLANQSERTLFVRMLAQRKKNGPRKGARSH